MLSKRILVPLFIVTVCLITLLSGSILGHAALILEGQLFDQGEKLGSERKVRMTVRIFDDEFGGNLIFEEQQEVVAGPGKALFTFEKGNITVRQKVSGLNTATLWVEVESEGQIMTPRLNLAEIDTVSNLTGESMSMAEAGLRAAGTSTLVIGDSGVTLGGLLDMGSESIKLGGFSAVPSRLPEAALLKLLPVPGLTAAGQVVMLR